MRILFLDIDGVLSLNSDFGRCTDNKWGAYRFDQKAVAVLNFILQQTNAEIVISSDWRSHYTLQEMREIFAHNFVLKGPIGFTIRSKNYNGDNLENGRAEEIKQWVELHAWKDDTKWVAIDDLNMEDQLYPNFVWCPNLNEGIKQTGVKEKIISKLK
jgi:HAD domain in Swiss Army Knife RNA repair proteins